MKALNLLLFGCCLLLSLLSGRAQNVVRTVTFFGEVAEQTFDTELEGVPGVVVELCWENDTMRTVTDKGGGFSLRKAPMGRALLRLSHVAYEPKEEWVNISPKFNLNLFTIRPKNVALKEVKVEGRVPALTVRGDTVIFHAAAFKTLLGDETIELVKQLPGVVVDDDGTVKVFGKQITKAYVDGQLIFGDSPSGALNNLSADEVISIKTYDQISAFDRIAGNVTAEKERVMDIETKHKYKVAKKLYATVGGGQDLDDSGNRYSVAGTGNYFSERFTWISSVAAHNLGNEMEPEEVATTNDYSDGKERDVAIWLIFKPKDPEIGPSYRLSGNYSSESTHDESRSLSQYLPTDDYQLRLYSDSLWTRSQTESYSANFSYSHFADHLMNFQTDYFYSRSREAQSHHSFSQLDERRSLSTKELESRSRSYQWNGALSRSLLNIDWLRMDLSAHGKFNKNVDDGWRLDTLQSSSTIKTYQTGGRGYQRNYAATLSFNLKPSISRKSQKETQEAASTEDAEEKEVSYDDWDEEPAHTLGWDITYERENEQNSALRWLLQSNGTYALDSLTSQQYTYNYHHLSNDWNYAYVKGNMRLRLSLGICYSRQAEERQLYPVRDLQKQFLTWEPQVSWSLGTMLSSVEFSYGMSPTLPSLEQLNNHIDDSTPLYYSSGNPNLRPSYRHHWSLTGNKMQQNGNSIDASLSFSLHSRAHIYRSRFFAEGGVLEEYDRYLLPAGSTFTTCENRNGGLDAGARLSYSAAFQPLKSTLTVGGNFNYFRSVGYINDALNHTYTQKYSTNVNLRSNFSRNYRIRLLSYTTFTKNYATLGSLSDTFSQRFELTSQNNFTDWLFSHLGGSYQVSRSVNGASMGDHRWVLNWTTGVRVMKRRGMISLTGMDLLNKTSNYSYFADADYQSEHWSRTYGRFWILTFSYKFNSTASSSR